MKPKSITAKNYKQFKPSEFVRSFASDIEVAKDMMKKNKRLKMDMYNFDIVRDENNEIKCLPCLGGMAVMNMNIQSRLSILGYDIEQLGDHIRAGDPIYTNHYLRKIYKNYKRVDNLPEKPIINNSKKASLNLLTKRINNYADLIEKSGQ